MKQASVDSLRKQIREAKRLINIVKKVKSDARNAMMYYKNTKNWMGKAAWGKVHDQCSVLLTPYDKAMSEVRDLVRHSFPNSSMTDQ